MISKEFISISRPRFWIYTFGPFLIGIAASDILRTIRDYSTLFSFGAYVILALLFFELASYFSYGSNLMIYGINDLADGDTDQYNDKKLWYEKTLEDSEEKHWLLRHRIIVTQILFFISISVLVILMNLHGTVPWTAINYPLLIGIWISFLFFSIFYSAKPIRAKSKPFIDGIFNVLYAIPGLFTYVAFGGDWAVINRPAFIAGWLRCVAMHTFSAIPDIEPDKKAWLTTTAVYFWKHDTLLYCAGVRLRSARLAWFALPSLKRFFYPAGWIYLLMIALCLHYPVMRIYKLFPIINGIIGFLLFRALSFNGVLR